MKIYKTQRHGKTGNRIYNIYRGMKNRCYNPKDYHYVWYGAKGIKICQEWLNDFLSFYNWSLQNGYEDHLTIDRIDNNKGYSPENCRWITIKEQCNNRNTSHFITIDGETKTLAQWSEISGICKNTICRNLKKGYTGKAILTPPKFHMNKSKIAQYDLNGNLIKIWDSLIQIKKDLNLKTTNPIANVCKEKPYHKTAYGYKWSYYPETK